MLDLRKVSLCLHLFIQHTTVFVLFYVFRINLIKLGHTSWFPEAIDSLLSLLECLEGTPLQIKSSIGQVFDVTQNFNLLILWWLFVY